MTPHHPSDLEWERRYVEHDTPWDKGSVAPPLAHHLQRHAIGARVLVPGCGRGHDARALANQPGCLVIGLDLSTSAIASATRLTAEANLSGSAQYVVGDFFHLSPEMTGSFDWVVEHTCFCAIEPNQRADYVRSAASALRAGGKIFGIFYLTPDVESGPPFAVSMEELTSLFEPNFELLESWIPMVSFPGRENRERVLILEKR